MILSLRWKDFFHRSHHEVILSLLLKCLWCQEELLHLCFTGVCVCFGGVLAALTFLQQMQLNTQRCECLCGGFPPHACFYQGFTKENRSRVEKLRCSAEIAKNRSVFKICDILHRYSYDSFCCFVLQTKGDVNCLPGSPTKTSDSSRNSTLWCLSLFKSQP